MTIAIGAEFGEGEFSDGIIVCADNKIVASDGATTKGSKVTFIVGAERILFAIADASADARTSKMVGEMIVRAAMTAHSEHHDIDEAIKEAMGSWHRSYGQTPAPSVEFILGLVIAEQHVCLRYCQPPATVLSCWSEPVAIGQGSRPVDPILPSLIKAGKRSSLESALLKIAYLMYIAKKEEGSACGGETSTVVITRPGGFTFVGRNEMEKAETLAEDGYIFTNDCCAGILSRKKEQSSELSKRYAELFERANTLEFPSLKYLERIVWRERETIARLKP